MARVKNMVRGKMASPGTSKEETRLPRAMFSGSINRGRTVTCSECGLTLRSGNLARHKRVKHAGLKLPLRGPVSNPGPREKLIIKLPREREARKRNAGDEEDYWGLMPTPQSEEKLNLGLA